LQLHRQRSKVNRADLKQLTTKGSAMKLLSVMKIIHILERKYGQQKLRIGEAKPFEVLIGTILSQRTKDEVTDKAAEKLLGKAKTPELMLKLPEREIVKLIKPVGFYRQKAKRILQICRILCDEYGGKVPRSRSELLKLPGVGFKTADCVLCFSYNEPCIPVDTHVHVVSRRLGLTKSDDPEEIREDLHKQIPRRYRGRMNLLLVRFGRDICRAVKPRCSICPIEKYCEYEEKK